MSIQYLQFPELSIEQRNQLFEIYADSEGALLLDSGLDNADQHFDMMAVKPIKRLTESEVENNDPLSLFKKHAQIVDAKNIPTELAYLPCLGGLFFSLAYDFSHFYAGIYGCLFIIDRQLHHSYLICNDLRQIKLFEQLTQQIAEVLKTPRPSKTSFSLTSDWQANFSKDDYAKAFLKVKQHIKVGDCYQVNLAQRFKANCIGDSWKAYTRLSKSNNAPFSAFINAAQTDILSLSPERFIRLEGKKVQTKPIKGTRPRGKTQVEDQQLKNQLMNSSKDKAENLMIVDLMRNDLGRVCEPGSIKVPELFKLESFQSVHHLVSTIIGQLEKSEDAFSLLRNSFPGGSITGAPKIKAMEIIDSIEPNARSFYCGSIGYIDIRGHMDSNISIRTLVRKQDSIYCWAGGGLVNDSKLDEEYQETFDKVSTILPVLMQ